MEKLFYIWIDDERPYPRLENKMEDAIVLTARDYFGAVDLLNFCFTFPKAKVYVDFDHDLGLGKSGYDVAKYIVENTMPIAAYHCHTMNPVGRKNIEQLLDRYGYRRFYL